MNKSAGSKLFKLKAWLTLPEAAKHLTGVCGEEVTEADVLRLALEGHLKLSVNFVNYTKACCGHVVGYEDVEWIESKVDSNILSPYFLVEEEGKPSHYSYCKQIDDTRFLNLRDEVTTIQGVWDLPMIGCEQLDIEHDYQGLTGGPAVTPQNFAGAFVEGIDGQMCQLQEKFHDYNGYGDQVRQQIFKIKNLELSTNHNRRKEELLILRKKKLEKFRKLENQWNVYDRYYPAVGLPHDSVLVVRTESLRAFEQFLSDEETDNQSNSKSRNTIGHEERHARNREQVLGAAFAVLGKWLDECSDTKGKPVASKIANKIEAEAKLFWPSGEPPLSVETMTDHLRDWIKKVNNRK